MHAFSRSAIVLGLLAAVGPFAIDMYLPALPAIRDDLGTTTGAAQMTLMVFFVAFGLCQLVYGPLADMAGRKAPLYFGLVLFLIGSVGCALSPSVEGLIGWRIVQGIGAACLAATAVYVVLSRLVGHVRLFGHDVDLPSWRMAIVQTALATVDVVVTAAIFHALLPPAEGLTFFVVLGVYVFAYTAGLLANVPGGLGVFDTAYDWRATRPMLAVWYARASADAIFTPIQADR